MRQNVERIPSGVVGLSLYSTLLSPISLLLLIENGQNGLFYLMWAQVGAFLASLFVANVLSYFADGLSLYEFISQRFKMDFLKVVLSSLFGIYQVIRISLISFLVSNAVRLLFGIPLWLTCVLLISATILYSWLGGLSLIIWIDAVQALFIVLWLITISGFWTGVATISWTGLSLDANLFLSFIVFIGGFCNTVCTYFSSQDMYQRIRGDGVESARHSIYLQAGLSLFSGLVLYGIGFLLQGVGQTESTIDLLGGTSLFSKIMFALVLVCAAQSTISSSLNAVAESLKLDFKLKFNIPQLTIFVGVVSIISALILSGLSVSNWYNWFNGVIGFVFGAVGGLLILALLRPTRVAILRYSFVVSCVFILSLFDFWNSWLNSFVLLVFALEIGGVFEKSWCYFNKKWFKRLAR